MENVFVFVDYMHGIDSHDNDIVEHTAVVSSDNKGISYNDGTKRFSVNYTAIKNLDNISLNEYYHWGYNVQYPAGDGYDDAYRGIYKMYDKFVPVITNIVRQTENELQSIDNEIKKLQLKRDKLRALCDESVMTIIKKNGSRITPEDVK